MKFFATGATITFGSAALTLREILAGGSITATLVGGVLTAAAGVWTYRTSRVKNQNAHLEQQKLKLEIEALQRQDPKHGS